MYTLNDEQVSSLETFIGKLEDSLIKSKIEKWFSEVEPTRRVESDQMERFVEMSVHLPVGLQYFPISFALAVKNTPETERREAAGEAISKSELTSLVDESVAHVPDVDSPEDAEETEHTLGKQKGVRRTRKVAKKTSKKK